MTERTPLAIALGIGLGIIMLLALIKFNMTSAHAAENPLGCFVGASAGANATATRKTDGATAIDLGTNSPMLGLEVGCKTTLNGFFLAAALRGHILNAKTKIDADSLKQNHRLSLVGNIGVPLNLTTSIYGVGGIAGTKYDIEEAAKKFSRTMVAPVLGIGVSTSLLGTGATGYFEYNAIFEKGATVNTASYRNVTHAVFAGVRYGF